jgi:hypothetical protein
MTNKYEKKEYKWLMLWQFFWHTLKNLDPCSNFLNSMHDKVLTINFRVLSFCTIGHNDIIATISCKGLGNNKHLISAWSKLHVYISIWSCWLSESEN